MGADRELPAPSWAEIHGAWPRGGWFDSPLVTSVVPLGAREAAGRARQGLVSSPGTLGPRGAWRVRGTRLSALNVWAACGLFESGSGATWERAELGMADLHGWVGSDWARASIESAICFALAFPDLAAKHCQERGEASATAIFERALAGARAEIEARAIEEASSPSSEGRGSARL